MGSVLFGLALSCLLGTLHAGAPVQPDAGVSSLPDNGQRLGRRYAESTIASDISKIVDSMVQKNFVNFLLNQREKRGKPADLEEGHKERQYNNLLKLMECMQDDGGRSRVQ